DERHEADAHEDARPAALSVIDPSITQILTGPEFRLEGAPAAPDAGASGDGPGFGKMLGQAMGRLEGTLNDSAAQSQAVATGQASDVTGVVMSVERANLELQ